MSPAWNSVRDAELQRVVLDDRLARFAGWCAVIYISIYALDSPIRYGLYFLHLSNIILFRDLLMWIPVLLMAGRGVLRHDLHPAFLVFGIFVAVGSVVSILNFGTVTLAAFATKVLLNSLFGVVAGSMLVIPGKKLGRYLLVLWVVTVVALILEKFVNYPWVGMHDTIAGVDVQLTYDWQIDDPASKRVAGLTRASISAAVLVSEITIATVFLVRPYLIRLAMLLATIGAVYLTTQKGALIGFVLVSLAILSPPKWRLPSLRLLTLLAVILDIGLPLWSNGTFIEEGNGGVFSLGSFAMRIVDQWPKTLDWIDKWQLFPFGVGLGGVGGGMQFLGGNTQPLWADNIFLLLYSFFGIPSLALFGWVVYGVVRSLSLDPEIAAPALAMLAFGLLYGVVVSLVEDPAAALFTTSGLGLLLQARRISDARPLNSILPSRKWRPRYRQLGSRH